MTNIITDELAAAVLDKSGGEDLKHCLTCEECLSTCFIADSYPDINPPREITRKIFAKDIKGLVASEFLWACTLCTRCTVDCPKNVHMDRIVRTLRGIARSQGSGPKRLEEGLQKIKEIGNSVGVSSEEFVENIEWLGEEAAGEIEGLEEDYAVPIDKEGAEFLYIPNPREFTSAPHMFSVYMKFFEIVQADWTFASNLCDISNWAYYMGDDETNLALVKRAFDTAKKLGVKTIVSTECGHGFKILRHDGPEMLGEDIGDIGVVSIVELAYDYFKAGKLKLRKGAVDEKVTYHDPCNVGRKLGIYESPRELLKYIAAEYVEMEPYGKYSVCCGGGGSVAQNTDMGQKRLEFGRPKRDQIVATGAQIVSTSCQMCLAQLSDIQSHYDLPVKTKSVMELVMESLDE